LNELDSSEKNPDDDKNEKGTEDEDPPLQVRRPQNDCTEAELKEVLAVFLV